MNSERHFNWQQNEPIFLTGANKEKIFAKNVQFQGIALQSLGEEKQAWGFGPKNSGDFAQAVAEF